MERMKQKNKQREQNKCRERIMNRLNRKVNESKEYRRNTEKTKNKK